MLTTLTDYLTEYLDQTKDPTTENNNRGIRYFNRALRQYVGRKDYAFRHRTASDTTVADQKWYYLPVDFDKFVAGGVTVSSQVYPVEAVYARKQWNGLQSGNNDTESDQARYVFIDIENKRYGLFPTPSSAGNTIELTYLARQKKMENEDYTTGTVSITNNDTTVTGSGTTFTAAMVGQYIELDDEGYLIASYTSATEIDIQVPYQGTTLSGATYRIGDASLLPDTVVDLPLAYACYKYYLKKDSDQANGYKNELNEMIALLDNSQTNNFADQVLFKRNLNVGNVNEDTNVTIS